MIYIILISLFISSLFGSQMDTINFKPQNAWIKSYWWTNKDYKFSFWLKVPFSFLQNGWHFCKMIMTIFFLFPIAIYLTVIFDINFWYSIPLDTLLYALYGIVFEIFYGRLG